MVLALLRLLEAVSDRGSLPRDVETFGSAIVSSRPSRILKSSFSHQSTFFFIPRETLCEAID